MGACKIKESSNPKKLSRQKNNYSVCKNIRKHIEQWSPTRDLGGWLLWISLVECMDNVGCIHQVFGQFPTCGIRGIVKPFPLNEVKEPQSLAMAVNLLSRIQWTSHLSELFNMIGGGGSMTLLGISLGLVGWSSNMWKIG